MDFFARIGDFESEENNCTAINKNNTIFLSGYNGIPQTLILNIVSWTLLILLFSILRNQAWDYGRLALFNNHRNSNTRWTQVFYRHGNELSDEPRSPDSVGETTTALPLNVRSDQGFFTWILVTFKLKTSEIRSHAGPDAVHYLTFQQHLIVVLGLIMSVCIIIILPVNMFNGKEVDKTTIDNAFSKTTMGNIASDSPWLWVHVICAILFIPLVVLIMRRCSGSTAFKTAPTRSIIIKNISIEDRNKTVIRNYIQELFPDVTIEDVQLSYNINKLTKANQEYEKISDARKYCESRRNRNELQAKPDFCSCKKVPAYEYYLKKERKLNGDVARLKAAALNQPLDTAFLTVSNVFEAQNIVNHFSPGTYRQWNLNFAPTPDDIFWENLSVNTSRWYIKWIAVNLVLFLMLFFLTTPTLILNLLNSLSIIKGEVYESPIMSEFLPTLLLWTIAALLPVCVAFSDKWLSHSTRSQQNYSIMLKCFSYLLLMILVLPSLGLASADALLKWSFSNETERWQCVLTSDRGSFYINYVITAGMIGTALELIRFPDLIIYIWELCTSKSKAEIRYIRKSILIEFPFGVHYAWTLLVFTITVVYSVSTPLITPFGMIYILLKHFNDRHNLYFVYRPSNMISQNGGKIHSIAVTMTKTSCILLLITLAAVTYFRGSSGAARAIVLIIASITTIGLFSSMSHIKRCTNVKRPSIIEPPPDALPPLYIADVLKPRDEANNLNETGDTNPGEYGSAGSDTISVSQISYTSVEA